MASIWWREDEFTSVYLDIMDAITSDELIGLFGIQAGNYSYAIEQMYAIKKGWA